MYVETSAIVAILLQEPERDALIARIGGAERPVASVVSAVVAAISIGRHLKDFSLGADLVEDAVKKLGVTVLTCPLTYILRW